MLRPLDDDVLKQIAEAGLDGALESGFDLEIVGHRALLRHLAVGLRQHGAGGVAVSGAGGLQLFQRFEARFDPGELLLAAAHRSRAPFVFDARAGQLGFARQVGDARRLDGVVRAAQPLGRRLALRRHPLRSDPHIVDFDVQLGERRADPLAGGRRVFERVTQSGRRIDGGKHLAARRLDVRLESLDLAMRRFVRLGVVRQRLFGPVAVRERRGGGHAPGGERSAGRLAPRVERVELRRHHRTAATERLDLLAVERDLLLLTVDRQFPRVRAFARRHRPRFGFEQLGPHPPEIGLDLRPPVPRRRSRARARRSDVRAPIPSPRPAADTCARTAPFPSPGAGPAASDTVAPGPPAASAFRAASRPRTRCRRSASGSAAPPRASALPTGGGPCTW